MIKRIHQVVTLIQTPKGVLWAEHGRYYKTVERAKSFVFRQARKIAKNDIRVYTYLEIR